MANCINQASSDWHCDSDLDFSNLHFMDSGAIVKPMNRQLKRIEQTLQKLEKGSTPVTAVGGDVVTGSQTVSGQTVSGQTVSGQTVSGQTVSAKTGRGTTAVALPDVVSPDRLGGDRVGMPAQSSVSFELQRRSGGASGAVTQPSASGQAIVPMSDEPVGTAAEGRSTNLTQPSRSVQPFVAEGGDQAVVGAKFQLPTFANPAVVGNLGFSTHQNRSNPDIALNLLQDTLKTVEAWRQELTQVICQIQDLYREGPIVDGWLECSTQKVNDTTQVLRHAEVNQLMDYVGQLCNDPSKTHPEYRLCGLNAEGKTWSSPCPPEQIASLSLAISRHQKLKPLLLRRSVLEKQLAHVAEEVVKMQSRIPGIH